MPAGGRQVKSGVKLLERMRRFWMGGAGEDHPLTAEERDEDRPFTAPDERARLEQEFVGEISIPTSAGVADAGASDLRPSPDLPPRAFRLPAFAPGLFHVFLQFGL
jgi:hypothetical protein